MSFSIFSSSYMGFFCQDTYIFKNLNSLNYIKSFNSKENHDIWKRLLYDKNNKDVQCIWVCMCIK